MITNELKKEKPTDGEMEVSYHTKPLYLRAVHLGRQSLSMIFDIKTSFSLATQAQAQTQTQERLFHKENEPGASISASTSSRIKIFPCACACAYACVLCLCLRYVGFLLT